MSTLLLCSGGSSLRFLETLDPRSFDAPLTVTVLDDRFSVDPMVSNFQQLSQTKFFQTAQSVINTRPSLGESLEDCAQRFETALRAWKQHNLDGKVLVIQGIGADGHTAGIAPMPDDPATFEKLFNDPGRWVVGYDAGFRLSPPQRITVTLTFLRSIVDKTFVYAEQEKKRMAIEAVKADFGSLEMTPARIIWEMKDVEWRLV
jgi:6-phosphogluconolactonase/glucosamine-6-phosphate isomerase/deaminase